MRTFLRAIVFSLPVILWGCASAVSPPGGASPERVSRPLEQPQPGLPFVRETAQTAEEAGARPVQLIRFGAAQVGDSVDGFVFIPKGRCALIYARGGESVEDLDLHVFADDGEQFGADEAPDDLPTLLLCPEESVRLYVAGRVAQGQGVVALAMHDLPASKAHAVALAIGARNFVQKPRAIDEAWPGLSAQISSHRQALGAAWTDLRRVALPVDARLASSLSVAIPQGHCLDAFVAPDQSVAQVDVVALDASGRIFARAQSRGAERFLVLCSPFQTSTTTLRLRPHAGQGMAAVVISTTKTPAERLNIHPTVVQHLVLENGSRSPLPEGLPGAYLSRRRSLKVGTRSSTNLSLDGCSRVDLDSSPPTSSAKLWFWNTEAELLAESLLAGASPLFVCARGIVRMDAEATLRAGELVTSFRRIGWTRDMEELLFEEPLGASHLLKHLQMASDDGIMIPPDAISRRSLSPSRLVSIPIELAAGKCEDLTIGVGAEELEVEARLVELPSLLELDFARGTHSLNIRSCSSRATKAVAELRSTRREGPVLVARRGYALED